jgi:SPP1 family predicted phage head-tail adaptor
MEAGKLRHRVTIERPTTTRSAVSGAPVQAWAEVTTVWASVRPRSAYQREQAAQQHAGLTHDVSIRYTADLTPGCRLKFDGRTLLIVGPAIDVDERHVELRMTVTETTAGGLADA